ncbi:MAG: sulfite exporter TauE/SafE family protein [Coprobacillus sp.]
MIIAIYIFVIFLATTLGAVAGLGGGVIIKPILDLIGYHDASTIVFISSWAVLSMAIYSTIKQAYSGIKIDWIITSTVAIGAILGGYIGNIIFDYLLLMIDSTLVNIVQALLLNSLLIFVLFNINNKNSLCIQNKIIFVIIGFLLGVTSSFLGIGGGPINVAVFTFFFSMDLKKATIYSIATILFSQSSKLITIAMTVGFEKYDCSILLYIIPTAIVGGIVGSYFNKKLNNHNIAKIFKISVMFIIFINILILFKNIF